MNLLRKKGCVAIRDGNKPSVSAGKCRGTVYAYIFPYSASQTFTTHSFPDVPASSVPVDLGAQSAASSPTKPLDIFFEFLDPECVLAHEQRQDPGRDGRYIIR